MAGLVGGSEGYYSGPGGMPGGGGMPSGNPPTGRRRNQTMIPGGRQPGGTPSGDLSGRGGFGSSGMGMGGGNTSMPNMGGTGQNMGGFGNQGATGFGGRMDVPGGRGSTSVPGGTGAVASWSPDFRGGGNPTTPNNLPTMNQPPTMNTPTGGLPPVGGPPAGSDQYGRNDFGQTNAARQRSFQSNAGGAGMPSSPQTPSIMHPGQPQSNNQPQQRSRSQIPWGGNTYMNNRNIYGGNTSTYNMTQQGDTLNQGQSMKRLQNRRRAQAAKAPRQQDRRGSTVQQNLNAMSGGMRYM